jgi:hypothetical protein
MRNMILVFALISILLAGCVEKPIGGDTDPHGCLPAAGYSWCELKQKCLREWIEPCDSIINLTEASEIAKNSSCMNVGNLTNKSSYNNVTDTWWLDLDTIKPGCAPACVVYEKNKSAEVNWRCTGLIPPDNKTVICSKPCHIYIKTINYTDNPPTCIASSEPQLCTLEYRSGDICLKYIECSLENKACKTTLDPKFDECISCFEDAIGKNISSAAACEDKYRD